MIQDQYIIDWMQELDRHVGDIEPDYDGVIAIVNEIVRHAPGALSDPCATDPHDIIQQLQSYRRRQITTEDLIDRLQDLVRDLDVEERSTIMGRVADIINELRSSPLAQTPTL